MRALVLDSSSSGLEGVLARRRLSGLDRFDEVWEGVLHMVPAPSDAHADVGHQLHVLLDAPAKAAGQVMRSEINIGVSERDYRVPDVSLVEPGAHGVWHVTARIVVEIVSPGDESWDKLSFYSRHEVDEVVIVDPATRSVVWLARGAERYEPVSRSRLIELSADELVAAIEWPAGESSAGAEHRPGPED